MGQTAASALFVQELHHALLHFYDAPELRRSPLIDLLGMGQREDPPTSLRHLLTAAINSLKPGPGVPPQASAWRTYQILSLRYVEQVSQREVGAELCLSIRQLRRRENLAVRTLADLLWTRHNLQVRVVASETPTPPATDTDAENQAPEAGTPSREQEMEWLRRSFPSEITDLGELIHAVLKTVAPLAQVAGVHLEVSVPACLPGLSAQQAAIRQALLSTLTTAIHCASGGEVQLAVRGGQREVCVDIRPQRPAAATASLPPHDRESLEMAGQLAALSGGSLALETREVQGCAFTAQFMLPMAERVSVLVVDDNADTLDLVERYLAGTRYRAIGVRDPRQVLALAAERAPDLIMLDVMLPGVDGWELLGRLREHPRTHGTPIIVCTILSLEDLALTLGASAFLRKPVSRRALLAALDLVWAPKA
jgi:CheY-like chemotaxis protein